MKLLTRGTAILALSLALSAPTAHAESEEAVDAATEASVTAAMTAEGYEVRKIVKEDGMIEVYAVKDGQTFEMKLDESFKIISTNEG